MRSLGVGGLAACAAAAVAGLSPGAAGAGGAAPVCVGTGLLATQSPGSSMPTAVGPALLGPSRAGTSLDSATDPAAGLTAGKVSLGIAGCVDPQGTPGGTTLRSGPWSLFGGAIRGSTLQVDLVPRPADGSGWWLRGKDVSLIVGGRQVTLGRGDQVAVGTWATLSARTEPAPLPAGAPLRWWRSLLELDLTRAHAGFAAGTTFLIGWVAADREPLAAPAVAAPAVTTPTTAPATTTSASPPPPAAQPDQSPAPAGHTAPQAKRAPHEAANQKSVKHKAAKHTAAKRAAPLVGRPLGVTPSLGPGLRTFPVVGDVAWGDTYGAERSDVPGGWHHGDDLFAPLGTPVVAVTDGTVFAVGWNSVGGWRLWLVDAAGNQYYYAHLSGYSALARNNHRVRRGQVLGFVGNTGDAVTTWPHVHFEVHPNGLLYLGYDGAVDPTTLSRLLGPDRARRGRAAAGRAAGRRPARPGRARGLQGAARHPADEGRPQALARRREARPAGGTPAQHRRDRGVGGGRPGRAAEPRRIRGRHRRDRPPRRCPARPRLHGARGPQRVDLHPGALMLRSGAGAPSWRASMSVFQTCQRSVRRPSAS